MALLMMVTKKVRRTAHTSDLLLAAAAIVMLITTVAGAVIVLLQTMDWACVQWDGCGYSTAAVSVDGDPCAAIATDVLKAGGTAADSVIAAMVCSGAVNPASMGLGGGFLLTYYSKGDGRAYTLNARETAPAGGRTDMFGGNPKLSLKGGLAVAIPGELRGYWALYERFGGGVPWSNLLEPTIQLCLQGNPVNSNLAKSLRINRQEILAEPSLSMFINQSTEDILEEGDLLKLPVLGTTLRVLQQDPDALYTGSLALKLVQDLKDHGAIITLQDLANYTVLWSEPVEVQLSDPERYNSTLYSVPPPGSGAVLVYMLNVLDEFRLTKSSGDPPNNLKTFQRLTETFKYAYGLRTHLGDPDYVDVTELVANMTSEDYARATSEHISTNTTYEDPRHYGAYVQAPEDHGTSHASVVAPNGDAVSATSTINTRFGALFASHQTGIILNNEMDDFSTPNATNYFGLPPSPTNFIEPGKRPLSSMCPAVLVGGDGEVLLVIGASGGTRITTAVAQVTMRHYWLGASLQESVTASRMHHQLLPMELWAEEGFDQEVLRVLQTMGHTVEHKSVLATVFGVTRDGYGRLWTAVDPRRNGQMDGY